MGWSVPPIALRADILKQLGALETAYRFIPEETLVEAMALPFYPRGLLLKVDRNFPQGHTLWYVRLENELVSLDGSIANIHYINATAPLSLAPGNVAHYLQFRLYFAREGLLTDCRAAWKPDGWQATVRIRQPDGIYEATLHITQRGEVTELQKERMSDKGAGLPPDFSFTTIE